MYWQLRSYHRSTVFGGAKKIELATVTFYVDSKMEVIL
jgi:hypothetical protein